ncbi:hypothetical protein BD410DRAFT_860906 [Rickenella mellea]|uniref:SH3 domain-containing protein n=1 Tax=Rickenella mellea TaxID=50990 RepID=A0A4Y7Q5C8_9AGAM|nr:hypothetical protein BD410DRAFT_860906 [Rickenella mellea]
MQADVDAGSVRRPHRQDTFDLRDQIVGDEQIQRGQPIHTDIIYTSASDEEHSVLEDDSSDEGEVGDYVDDDQSSELSIPNESIDFDLVYSLTNFAATVEGQASVVKGDSLFLIDDSNSYWWLVRVLKTQEIGYIPAENIETPFERLARLNKHRNVDLASATQAELLEGANQSRENLRLQVSSRAGANSVSPIPGQRNDSRNAARSRGGKAVAFTRNSNVFRYPPAVWNEEDEDGEDDWDEDDLEYDELVVKDEAGMQDVHMQIHDDRDEDMVGMEPDDGMNWEEEAAEEIQQRQMVKNSAPMGNVPGSLRPGAGQQQQVDQQQQAQGPIVIGPGLATTLRQQTSRERLFAQQEAERVSSASQPTIIDPAEVTETKKVVITPPVARDSPEKPSSSAPSAGPLLPSAIMQQQQQQQEQDRKRAREEIEAAEEAARKKANISGGRPPEAKEMARTASGSSVSSNGGSAGGGKLRKERSADVTTDDESGKDKGQKKKGRGVFGSLFGRKDKEKDGKEKGLKGSSPSTENINAGVSPGGNGAVRGSEDSGRSSTYSPGHSTQYTSAPPETGGTGPGSPVSNIGVRLQQQQQQVQPQPQPSVVRGSGEAKRANTATPPGPAQSQQVVDLTPAGTVVQQPSLQVSQHASQLRERDQQQQALYQQYLKRSPSSPPDQPSYGLQSASAIMPTSSSSGSGMVSGLSSASGLANAAGNLGIPNAPFRTQGGRPGSLILSPDGQGFSGIGVPELSVIRVFAGRNLQSEATFKTVLLNNSTTAGDLVRQAMQRFRLVAGEDAGDYYLTVKQVEGGASASLRPEERPLVVFEELVEQALEMPKVKRSSMGSISSIASNLSSHPAIKKLAMNDFTDDSAVKFYLNRRNEDGKEDSLFSEDEDATVANISHDDGDAKGQYLSVNTSIGSNVGAERFSSPSFRFVLQLVIYPEELPDDMVFDPHTEAIVFKDTLRDRSQSSALASPGVSQNFRKKMLVFPKNITVAEVIELGLERFGILEGVVDGGDEVEDKTAKRRSSSTRVRYTLIVQVDGQERELSPSSKVIDAFPRPPTYRRSGEVKRRSIDSAHLLATAEDVQADDPVFLLRRAVTYRSTASSRHRLSAPLDEIALSHLHRESVSNSMVSTSSMASEPGAAGASGGDDAKPRQPSRQEIIAAQRAASRANQKAMLSTQANSHRGVDVLLPGKAMLRSSRYDVDDRMRYSYVQPDGETYDISDIIEEEFKDGGGAQNRERSSASGQAGGGDLLQGVVNGFQPGVGAKLIDRVLNKINSGKNAAQLVVAQSLSAGQLNSASTTGSFASTTSSSSEYSNNNEGDTVRRGGGSRSVTPTTATTASASGPRGMSPSPQSEPAKWEQRPRATTPTTAAPLHRHQQPSIASVMSDISVQRSITPTGPRVGSPTMASGSESKASRSATTTALPSSATNTAQPARKPIIPKDDFGLTDMLAVIELRAGIKKTPRPPLDEVEELLFGPPIDVKSIHPQVRDAFGNTFKKLEEMDAALDDLLFKAMHLF